MLKAITNLEIHQILLKYWFSLTLCHGSPCKTALCVKGPEFFKYYISTEIWWVDLRLDPQLQFRNLTNLKIPIRKTNKLILAFPLLDAKAITIILVYYRRWSRLLYSIVYFCFISKVFSPAIKKLINMKGCFFFHIQSYHLYSRFFMLNSQ